MFDIMVPLVSPFWHDKLLVILYVEHHGVILGKDGLSCLESATLLFMDDSIDGLMITCHISSARSHVIFFNH